MGVQHVNRDLESTLTGSKFPIASRIPYWKNAEPGGWLARTLIHHDHDDHDVWLFRRTLVLLTYGRIRQHTCG